jgi:hypothetical protein
MQMKCARAAAALLSWVPWVDVVQGLLAAVAGSEAAVQIATRGEGFKGVAAQLCREPEAFHHGRAVTMQQCQGVANAILCIGDARRQLTLFLDAGAEVGDAPSRALPTALCATAS